MTVELFYYLDDIERQVDEHPPPPSDPDTLPDPYSFSYTVGVVGEFVDRKTNARLLFASNRGHEGQEIAILYQTQPGIRGARAATANHSRGSPAYAASRLCQAL